MEEVWSYDDAARSTTYQPADGPLAATTVSTLSADGSALTLEVGGNLLRRITRRALNGKLVEVTEVNDDSNPAVNDWTTVSERTLDPGTGSATFRPWDLSASGVKVALAAAGVAGESTVHEGEDGSGRLLQKVTTANGQPTAIESYPGGVKTDVSIARVNGHVQSLTESVGTESTTLTLNAERRVGTIVGPGSNQTYTYGGGQGYRVNVQDSIQGTNDTMAFDATGDFTEKTGFADINWSSTTTDDTTGSSSTVNTKLQLKANFYGEALQKIYAGGTMQEVFTRAPDGTITGHSVSGPGGSVSQVIEDSLTQRKETYDSGASQLSMTWPKYKVGLPKGVTQAGEQPESRTFTFERFQLKEEKHETGALAGWKVEFLSDARGRLETIRASGVGRTREFSLGYDAASLLRTSSATFDVKTVSATTERELGRLKSITRDGLTTVWNRNAVNSRRLENVTNSKGTTGVNYTYGNYDAQNRIKARVASRGQTWTSLDYDEKGRLWSGMLSQSGSRSYGYDDRNNRLDQGANTAHAVNDVDQVTGRSIAYRTFGVHGAVKPGSLVEVFSGFFANGSTSLTASAQGGFFGVWDVTQPGALTVDATVRRTYLAPGEPDKIAEQKVYLRVPPASETLRYDGAGRLEEDAYWNYTWDAASRLTRMVAKLPSQPNSTEEVRFGYDANGRRVWKQHIITPNGGTPKVENSTVLWAGTLPLCETRSKDGQNLGRRWFQWGTDLSGSLDGAGGIGGLVAIHEEDVNDMWKRTLLPVTDGIGNVTAVLDAKDGRIVAQYDFGPFGEPLGESGEANACPFRWQTKWYDAESEHYYFLYRHYDPRMGRWLSRDPLGEAGGFNLYAYCGNDPVNRHDPLGLSSAAEVNGSIADARMNLSHLLKLLAELGAREEIDLEDPLVARVEAANNHYWHAVTLAMAKANEFAKNLHWWDMLSQQNVDTINAPHQLPVLMLPQSPDQGALRALWSDGSSVTNELADRAGTAAEIAGGVETGADIVMIGTGTGGLIKGGMTVVKAGGKRALVKYGANVGKTFAVGAGAAWGIGAIGTQAGMSPEQIELAQRGIGLITMVKALRVTTSGKGVPATANFAQTGFREKFSKRGQQELLKLTGVSIKTIDDLVIALESGAVSPTQIPVNVIRRGKITLILNTRTAQALERAGIPRNRWNSVDKAGNALFEELLTDQLQRNQLSPVGTPLVFPE